MAASSSSRTVIDSPSATGTEGTPVKEQLLARLERIRAEHRNANRSSAIATLISELRYLSRTLAVTAHALDTDMEYHHEIEAIVSRADSLDRVRTDDAGNVMNGMLATYEMYALLAKMRFIGRTDEQNLIQEIHDEAIRKLQPEIPVVDAAAGFADACYSLSRMIIDDIDSESHFESAFEHIEHQYAQGKRVAGSEEDHFLNGIFRTFEISQLWLLALNPRMTKDVSEMNSGISSESAEATNVGTQMGIAVKYLYHISTLIAEQTIELTL
ncbi:MAG: hypothetical protein KFH87_09015 [Bacteroidetes bacterium]|nr:hypothetical protein [Bacteroidota bacterium]